ncbi:uncharacterized protein H6S33_008358 [Morchella sextelata]|uniref:uncharacterized protein n=1 Tax=Morchella sextelata TaxID=1174677 RepID=UPI001D035F35|nr:uncharacterized protein H6S33_008358 [Morchella sextelata]KAH0602708.1 hypothetical protein H6S33_008358 [Morchella sextelata]
MSLNGLDTPELTEAFAKACAEPGSWFWIKYTSRDDVELLCQGINGAEEMREAAEKEPDDSPLYGFIRFRRRNILIKYIPEGTSRVLKARSQVHFQSVAERFIPNDTTFSISTPKELRDNALTSACSTHTATASISSSNSSLRARRLTDIAESADEEEPPTAVMSAGSPVTFGEIDGKGKTSQGLAVVITAHDSSITDGGPGSPVFLDGDRDLLGSPLGASFSRDSLEPRRKSTGTSPRPSSTDLYGPYIYTPREKVRLGPRPHVEPVKRPHTSGERPKAFPSPDQEIRPVVSVPKSVQIPPRKSKESRNRSLSNESLRSEQDTISFLSIEIEDSPPPSPKSLSPVPSQEPALTPEKQRLMRALQLRRKTMQPELKEQSRRDEEAALEIQGMKESDEISTIAETDEDEDREEGESGIVSQKIVEPDSNEAIGGQEGVDVLEESSRGDAVNEGVTLDRVNEQTETGDATEDLREQDDKLPESPVELQSPESTKVRGEPDSDVDTESDHTEISIMTDSRPVTMTAIQQPIPSMIKSSSRSHPTKPPSPDPLAPKVLKRTDRPIESEPINEPPVPEAARSVSAPFLKPTAPAAGPRKAVGGGGGGVAQRIRQLEMLSVQKAAAAAGKSPPVSRGSSPTPPIPQYHPNRPSSVHVPVALRRMSNPPAPLRPTSSVSRPSTPNTSVSTLGNSSGSFTSSLRSVISTPSLPKSSPPKSSPAPRMEIIERNNRPELQVTTQITRDEQGTPHPSFQSPPAPIPAPESAKSLKSPNSFSRRSSVDITPQDPVLRSRSVDVAPPPTTSSRGQSIERGRGILSRSSSSRDLENLPEKIPTPSSSPKPTPTSPRPPSTYTNSSKKSKKEKERRGSSSSSGGSGPSKEKSRSKSKSPTTPKSPKSPGFLQKMSAALTGKKSKEDVQAPAPVAPAEPAKKSYLLAGWINAQLPDTMLWRRRCLKIDSSGWLFLSLSEDEV